MDIKRILHPENASYKDENGWSIVFETDCDKEMQQYRRSMKPNAIKNSHIVNCTLPHLENLPRHKMKVQWTRCTSVLCRERAVAENREACLAQLRMSTCLETHRGVICQANEHLSDDRETAEPIQGTVTEQMKAHIIRMLFDCPNVKPQIIYNDLLQLHERGVFGKDAMPTKIQLRNALMYLKTRKMPFKMDNRV